MPDRKVLALITQITAAQDIDTAWKTANEYFSPLGFSRVNYGFTRFYHPRGIGDHDDALFLTTCGPEYTKNYFRQGFYARTPAWRWAQENYGMCTWKWIDTAWKNGELSADENAAMKLNELAGISAGISISFSPDSSRARGALGLIADPNLTHDDVENIFEKHGPSIQTIASVMHLKILQLPQLAQSRVLSPRQREALEWVADGKTTQDVAMLMGISTAMVEKHLRLVREALGVETTAHAVAKSALLNMIFQQKTPSAK